MELAAGAVKPFCAERFVKPVRGICRFAKKEHRCDAAFDEPARHRAQKEPTNALTVKAPQNIDFVQFAGEAGHTSVVECALGKADKLASGVFNDNAEPALIG